MSLKSMGFALARKHRALEGDLLQAWQTFMGYFFFRTLLG
jgi:hypothetical protein